MSPSFRSIPEWPAPGETLRSVGRGEWLAGGGVVLLGLVLRGLLPGTLAVEHFDEGVYASNLYCGHLDPPFAYPMRHLYAPPLFPALLEWVQILAGPSAVMWVNVLLGSLTVAAVWYATRGWFGRSAAIAAALLAATSEYHIAFSRMALTDVPLSLFMLLGVFAGWRAILSGRPVWIVAAGMFAGLAWCTKYNGWLTLAVTGAGTAAWLLSGVLVPSVRLGNTLAVKLLRRATSDQNRRGGTKTIANCKLQDAHFRLGSVAVRWGLTAAIAGVMFWVFVVRDLAPLGGYAAVAKNHAGYFVGLGGWWSGFLRQAQAHELLMGWPTSLGIAAAWLACFWTTGRAVRSVGLNPRDGGTEVPPADETRTHAPRPFPSGSTVGRLAACEIGLGVLLLSWLVTASGLLAIAALAGLVGILQRPQSSESADDQVGSSNGAHLAAWLMCAWFFGLLVATPLYFPYPRLSLPWVVACWPLAGAALAAMARTVFAVGDPPSVGTDSVDVRPPEGGTPTGGRTPRIQGPERLIFAACGGIAALCALLLLTGRGSGQSAFWDMRPAWQDRTIVAHVAGSTLAKVTVAKSARRAPGRPDVDTVIYVHGDPALFFHLSRLTRSESARSVVVPVAEPPPASMPTDAVQTFLVSQTPPATLDPHDRRFHLRGSDAYFPSRLVLLDRLPAAALRDPDPDMRTVTWVYEIGSTAPE